MTDWSQLTHAYGTAEDVPGLLDEVEPDPGHPVWVALWSRLCHQGTVYPASFAALPVLVEKARHWSAADRVMPLVLAGAIVASVDQPYGDVDPHVAYAAEVAELAEFTEDALRDAGLADKPKDYVLLLAALLGFEGVEVWGEQLDGINDGEYEVPCPHCEAENFIVLGRHGYFSTTDSVYMKESGAKRVPLHPRDPSALDGVAKRLHTRTLADSQPEIAKKFTYVFGNAHCAECGALFGVDEAIVARWGT